MTSVGGVPLAVQQHEFVGGAVFRLADGDLVSSRIRLGVDTVDLDADARLAVVNLAQAVGVSELAQVAHERAQQALDIAAFRGEGAVTLPRAHEEHILWWRVSRRWLFRAVSRVTLRVVVRRYVNVRMGPVTATVTRPDGTVVDSPPPPDPEWTAALRYFRLSQAAEDLLEAYRNAFLALEAILSERIVGGPRGQRAWLEHSLRNVSSLGMVDLKNFVTQTNATDLVATFLDEQYDALRNATFHAKAGQARILPGSTSDREDIAAALTRLLRVVIDLAADVVGTRFRTGAMTRAGFELLYIKPRIGSLTLFLEQADAEESTEAVKLPARYLGKLDRAGYEHGFIGRIAAKRLGNRTFDGVRARGPAAGFSQMIDAVVPFPAVDARGADVIEVVFGFVLNNRQLPRARFPL